jgi:sulfatase modifying factor 1
MARLVLSNDVRRTTMRVMTLLTILLTGCGTVVNLDVDQIGEPDDGILISSLVLVPGGDFTMGCDPVADSACDPDEYPLHPTTLSSFHIDRYETTQATYEACVTNGGCSEPSADAACNWDPTANADLPVVCVTFAQARAYCDWRGLRLPTEAEWERAARGTNMNLYPWGDSLPDCTRANSSECGEQLMDAGALPNGATADGLLDMAGNAGEWVSDWYNADYYGAARRQDPAGPSSGELRVIRGGMITLDSRYLRSSNRSADDPTQFRFSVGFRCAASAE